MMADQSCSYGKSIVLPCDQVFRNLKTAKRFAIDIGGSLTKLAYCSTVSRKATKLSFSNDESPTNPSRKVSSVSVTETDVEGSRLHFVKFETKYIESCLDFIRDKVASVSPCSTTSTVRTTGGGAFKYARIIEEKLGLKVCREDEMECLIRGCNFLLRNIPDESFTHHHHEQTTYRFQTVDPCNVFPYLLVNIGSGVSVIKVEGERSFMRIGGTSMGGGTFWGLGSLLTQAKNFDELLALADQGDHRNVDMLVSDIYGGDYARIGLQGDLIASSFGKTVRGPKDSDSPNFKGADLARSLLLTVSNSIGQIAHMYAQEHNVRRVYFGGFFIRGHPITMRTIAYAVNYWSKGETQALFLRHEGYLGAVGAFVKGAEEDFPTAVYSWNEFYAGSSGFSCPVPRAFLSKSQSNGALIHQLEMDCAQKTFTHCPVLYEPAHYVPDTVDLTQDDEAREYYLSIFETSIDKTVRKAIESQCTLADAEERALGFKHSYIQHLRLLRQQPCAYGFLNVRSLLDLNEQLLAEYYFPDAYILQKQQENQLALALLQDRLQFVSKLTWEERQLELVRGLLTGNIFDWGASEVVKLMDTSSSPFTFSDAETKLPTRPWLVDDYDVWLERLKGPKHQCAAIFVDNSGPDIVLGVIPFVIELLNRGTQVLLCANSSPALNDVTFAELKVLLESVSLLCPEIASALKNGHLKTAENGQCSPCLDLSRIDGSLALLMENVDLIVLEGMGRSIHTNYNAEFLCESLKIAVVKNQWIAQRLGGDMFAVIFKYEKGKTPVLQQSKTTSARNSEISHAPTWLM